MRRPMCRFVDGEGAAVGIVAVNADLQGFCGKETSRTRATERNIGSVRIGAKRPQRPRKSSNAALTSSGWVQPML